MTIEKINFIDMLKSNIILNILSNKKMLLSLFLLPILFIAVNSHNFYSANALSSSNNVVDQSQSNSQSNIQSNSQSNSNNSNCTTVQSQTTVNGKTTVTSKNICGDNTSVSSSSSSDNSNLKGPIVSAEYNLKTGVIINSVFGNWSLTTKGDNSKDFKSSFIVQPIYYSNFDKSDLKAPNNAVLPQNTNTTSYVLSNFIVNSVQQVNSNTMYGGKIDVVQNVHSSDVKRPDETNVFKGKYASVSILGDRVLIINFDKPSTNLFDAFKNIPLVGLVTSNGVK